MTFGEDLTGKVISIFSSSNFLVTADGEVSASDMHLTGTSIVKNVSVADYFAYNNIVS